MSINSSIRQILNLERGEGRLIILPIIYSFFAGSAFAFFVTGATSLLLNNAEFTRELIPLSFIAAGIMVFVAGKIFDILQHKFSFSITIKVALGFLLFSILIFIGIFYFKSNSLLIVFVIYAWVRIFAYIHAITFWGMLGRIFSIQQAKRIFALISGGEVFAAILSFFSVPFLLKVIETKELLLISIGSLLPAFLLMFIIIKKFKFKAIDKKEKESTQAIPEKNKKKSTGFRDSKYFRLFFLIAFIPIFAQMFADFIFQTQTKAEFTSKENLTAFVGLFFGVSAIVEFVLKTFVSGRLINKYGIKLGLLAFPVLLGISFLLASVFGILYETTALFFSFVAMGRLFSRAIRTSFNDPATQILYQPLPKEERINFQNKIESGPKAFGGIVAGILIFIVAKFENVSLVVFSVFLVAVIVFWIKIAGDIYSEYKSELQKVLSRRSKEKTLSKYEIIYNILSKKMRFAHESAKEKIVYIIRVLYPYMKSEEVKEQRIPFSKIVEESKSKNYKDRLKVASYLHHYKPYRIEKLLLRLMKDENKVVRNQAIITAGRTEHAMFYSLLISKLIDKDTKGAAYSAIFYLKEKILAELAIAFRRFENNAEMQIAIIDIFENSYNDFSKNFLINNINHPRQIITDRIIKALGTVGYRAEEKYSIAINELMNKHIANYIYAEASLFDLKSFEASEKIIIALKKEKRNNKENIYNTLSVLYENTTIDLIREYLESKNDDTRSFALEVADTVISDAHKELLLPVFNNLQGTELMKSNRLIFPQERLSVQKRLIDIINSDISAAGIHTKASSIEKLQRYLNDDTIRTFKVNLIHPNPLIKEISALSLYSADKNIFKEQVKKFEIRLPELTEIQEKILGEKSKRLLLNYEIISLLKSFKLFENFSSYDLLEYTLSTTQITIEPNQKFTPDLDSYFYLVLIGELKSELGERNFMHGEIITAFNYSEKILETMEFPVMVLETDRILLNDFFRKYSYFVEQFEII